MYTHILMHKHTIVCNTWKWFITAVEMFKSKNKKYQCISTKYFFSCIILLSISHYWRSGFWVGRRRASWCLEEYWITAVAIGRELHKWLHTSLRYRYLIGQLMSNTSLLFISIWQHVRAFLLAFFLLRLLRNISCSFTRIYFRCWRSFIYIHANLLK